MGARTKVKIAKNKVAPPFKTTEFDIIYGKGISAIGCTLDMAALYEIVKKAGAWYSYEGEKIGQGRENAKTFLEEHPDIYAEIEERVREAIMNKSNGGAEDAVAENLEIEETDEFDDFDDFKIEDE